MQQKKHIVVIGWDVDHTVEGLLQGLGDFAPADSSVTIISPEKPDDVPGESGACTFRHLEGSIASRQVLMEVNDAHAYVMAVGNSACCLCSCTGQTCEFE